MFPIYHCKKWLVILTIAFVTRIATVTGWCNVIPCDSHASMGNVGNAALIWTSFLSSCFMQLVSNPKVNHPEPQSLQVVCNQGNHSLLSQICMSAAVYMTRIFAREQCLLLCIALIWCLSKLPSPYSNFSCSSTPCVLYCPLLAATRDYSSQQLQFR